MPQRQLPTPHPPIGGLVQGFLYPTQTPPVRALARQQPPASPPFPIHGASITDTTSSYLFSVTPPRATRRSFRVGTKVAVVTGTIRDVTTDTVLTYAPLQPDRTWTDAQVRYRQDVWAPQYSVFIPTINTDFWTSPAPPPVVTPWRPLTAPTVPIEGLGVSGFPADVFILNTTPDGVLASYRQRPKPVITVRGIRGPAVPVPQPFILSPQPGDAWWRPLQRRQASSLPLSLGGASSAPTFLFPVAQPDRAAWFLRRAAVAFALPPRVDGVEPQALFLFPVMQPAGWMLERLGSRLVVTPQLTGAFTPPPAAQTSLFPVDQPSRTQWYVPSLPSQQVPAPLALSGATSVATDPIPTVGNSVHTYWPWRDQLVQSRSALIWSAIVVVVVPPLAAADACDTFRVPAERPRFTVSADLGALFVPADRGSFTVAAEPGTFTVPGCQS